MKYINLLFHSAIDLRLVPHTVLQSDFVLASCQPHKDKEELLVKGLVQKSYHGSALVRVRHVGCEGLGGVGAAWAGVVLL